MAGVTGLVGSTGVTTGVTGLAGSVGVTTGLVGAVGFDGVVTTGATGLVGSVGTVGVTTGLVGVVGTVGVTVGALSPLSYWKLTLPLILCPLTSLLKSTLSLTAVVLGKDLSLFESSSKLTWISLTSPAFKSPKETTLLPAESTE